MASRGTAADDCRLTASCDETNLLEGQPGAALDAIFQARGDSARMFGQMPQVLPARIERRVERVQLLRSAVTDHRSALAATVAADYEAGPCSREGKRR
jgi:hypothetical protein